MLNEPDSETQQPAPEIQSVVETIPPVAASEPIRSNAPRPAGPRRSRMLIGLVAMLIVGLIFGAIGGGSTLDTAKALACLRTNPGPALTVRKTFWSPVHSPASAALWHRTTVCPVAHRCLEPVARPPDCLAVRTPRSPNRPWPQTAMLRSSRFVPLRSA